MIKKILMFLIAIVLIVNNLNAQLLPQDAIKSMTKGINIGNTLEPNDGEGTWGNPALQESYFDDYVKAGFNCVRIPITWDKYTSYKTPFTIDAAWMNRIEQIVDWGLKRKLIIIINAHHEKWIKESYTKTNADRFDSIWSQISKRFKDKSDSLFFEMINEPEPLEFNYVNELNDRVLKIIRKTNPTRIVLFSGHKWSNSQELIQANIPDDKFLMAYYHSYDPWPFGLDGPGTYGSDTDISNTEAKFKEVAAWSKKNNIPVILGEFAYTKKCDYNSRMCAYATVTEKALQYNIAPFVWDDGGDFKIFNRNEHTWNEIKDILIYTYKESPNKLKISTLAGTLVKIQWKNRTTQNDSIIIERKVNNGNFYTYAKIAPNATEFIDNQTSENISYYYRLKTSINDSIEIQSYPIMIKTVTPTRKPFKNKIAEIPGIVEAENFDEGGEGITYHDADNYNLYGEYRTADIVDIGEHSTGKYHIGNIVAGEWLEYTVNIKESGVYNISVVFSAGENDGGIFNLQFTNGTTKNFVTTSTGSWTTYSELSQTFELEAGEQIMRLNVVNQGFNIDNLIFSQQTQITDNKEVSIEIFPNPFSNEVTIKGAEVGSTFSIYDISGKNINTIEVDNNKANLSLSLLEKGIYIIEVKSKNNYIRRKLIKE